MDVAEHLAKRARYSAEPDLKVVVGAEQQKTFHVHATNLIQSSNVFREILTSEHFAKPSLELPDDDPTHFELFYLSLTVASHVPLSTEQAFAVGAFANKYDHPQLKDKMDLQVASQPSYGHPPAGPHSLRFALTHNLHRRAERCVAAMPLDPRFMPQLLLLTEQDCSEHGKQTLLLRALWPRLRKAAGLDGLSMPAPAQLRCMWPFLTARLAPAPDGAPEHELRYAWKARWLDTLEPAKWLGDPPDSDRKAAYAVLLRHLWPALCADADVKVVSIKNVSIEHIQTMWPFVSRAVLSASYPDKYKTIVTDARAVLATVKQWPDQLYAELPAYPKRSTGAPDEEAKRSLERKIALCGLEKLGQGKPLTEPASVSGTAASSNSSDSESEV